MFSVELLNEIRSYELDFYRPFLPMGARLLEIGGGTGIQAKQLAELGLKVTSIDIADSNYSQDRVFPIVEYDGEHLPFDDASFDIIFSSNVLEHIRHLEQFHRELSRVLLPDGYSIHAMPSATWRLWTNITHYIDNVQMSLLTPRMLLGLLPRKITIEELRRIKYHMIATLRPFKNLILPPPQHGEKGNAISEIYYFSRFYWKKHFYENGYNSVEIFPMRLFYTGHMILGKRLPLKSRVWLSYILGSSCILYKIKK